MSEPKPERPRAYLPQLDGVRALAVAAVVVHHYSEGGWGPAGNAGVKLFFVLSGFLITGILLDGREQIRSGGAAGTVLGHFYARRCLRIFPLYYFVIAVTVAIGIEPAREIAGWLLSYTVNFRMGFQDWYFANFAHFWSLAVEEQFYLVWPWLILLLPRSALVPMMCLAVAVGPFYRWYSGVATDYTLAAYILLPACLDSLGAGALLAVATRSRFRARAESVLGKVVLPAGVLGMVALAFGSVDWRHAFVFGDLALAAVFCWMVAGAAKGWRGPVGAALGRGPLPYVGKISYGVYVYHPFMRDLALPALVRALGLEPPSPGLNVALSAVLTLVVSALSWRLLERPLNQLKRFFP